jgi:hypothetical protein
VCRFADKAAKKQGKGGDEPSRPMYVVKEAVRREYPFDFHLYTVICYCTSKGVS